MNVKTANRDRTDSLLHTVSHELQIPADELLRLGIRTFLERRLRTIKADIFEICGCYGVADVEGMEARYREGTLAEDGSWRDLQRLDLLEYKRDKLSRTLESL